MMYGNLYTDLSEVFKPAYEPVIAQFRDGQINLSQLNTTLINLLTANEGASIPLKMLQDTMVTAILSDLQHPFNLALSANDVYDWAPAAPTRLVYCTADDQVPYENAILADSVMNANGVADLTSYNADPAADHVGCVFPATFYTILFFSTLQQVDDVPTAVTNTMAGELELSPNPASDAVSLKNLPTGGTLLLRNLTGKSLRTFETRPGDFKISLRGIPAGLYVVQLVGQNKTWIGKLVVR
jgi:hypothetical protein